MKKLLIDNSCCNPDSTDPNQGPKDCLDSWKLQKADVDNAYAKIAAKAAQAEERYKNAYAWEMKLKTWLDNIKTTDEKGNKVLTELQIFLAQFAVICPNAKCTVDALAILLCQTKGVFDCLYTLKTSLLDKLKEDFDCLNNLSGEGKRDVLECIIEFEAKLKAACELQDSILKKLVETYKCANLLYVQICGVIEKEGNYQDLADGLHQQIEDLLAYFDGTATSSAASDDDVYTPDESMFPCDENETKPLPKFPLNTNPYYTDLSADYTTAVTKSGELKTAWDTCRKERDLLLAQKTSLAEAIVAAEAAENGK